MVLLGGRKGAGTFLLQSCQWDWRSWKPEKILFYSTKCRHIHLLLQVLGRRKKENLQEDFLVTPATPAFLFSVCLQDISRARWWSIGSDVVCTEQCCMTHYWGYRHSFYLDSWTGRCRVDGNHIVLPLLNGGKMNETQRGKGTHPSPEIQGQVNHRFLPASSHSTFTSSNPNCVLNRLVMLIIPAYWKDW